MWHLSPALLAQLYNYFLYHIETPDNMVFDIDHYIETGHV
jgi:hypothetical protein